MVTPMVYKHQSIMTVTHTGEALPRPIFADVGVGLVEGVTTNAMGLGLPSRGGATVEHVGQMRYSLEVASPTASLDFAQMVDLHAIRNFAECKPVGINKLGVSSGSSSARPEMAIALRIERTNPEPTVTEFGMQWWNRTVFVDVTPKAFFDRDAQHFLSPRYLYSDGSTDGN